MSKSNLFGFKKGAVLIDFSKYKNYSKYAAYTTLRMKEKFLDAVKFSAGYVCTVLAVTFKCQYAHAHTHTQISALGVLIVAIYLFDSENMTTINTITTQRVVHKGSI